MKQLYAVHGEYDIDNNYGIETERFVLNVVADSVENAEKQASEILDNDGNVSWFNVHFAEVVTVKGYNITVEEEK